MKNMTNKIELLFNILVSMLNIGISQLCDLACRGSIISAGYDRLCMMLLEKRVVDGWETRLCGNFILFVITYVTLCSTILDLGSLFEKALKQLGNDFNYVIPPLNIYWKVVRSLSHSSGQL